MHGAWRVVRDGVSYELCYVADGTKKQRGEDAGQGGIQMKLKSSPRANDDRNRFYAGDVVQLKQFGNGESHPFYQGIERAAFHDKSGNVIACGDPNRRLVVPCHFYKIVHNQSPVRNATSSITKNLKKSNGGI